MIEFFSPSATSSRFHWPMQGPQALASTMAPIVSRASIWPSRWMVRWICSEPGVSQRIGLRARDPVALACRATSAARDKSS